MTPQVGRTGPAPVPEEEREAWEHRLEESVLAPLRHSSRRYWMWVGFLALVVGWGVFAWGYQVANGLIVTGMRDRISWGMYILTFIFVIGISHAGTLLSAILRVTKARWQLSITRMAEFITVVALMVGGLFPLIDLGRPDRFLYLIRYGRWQSPLLWDLMAVTTYLAGSTIYLYLPLIPDFARARDRLAATAPRWRRTFFSIAAVGWTGTRRQRKTLDRAMTIMMITIIPVAVSVHTVISWIFAMTLREPFNSTVFGAYFVAGAIYSGVAAIILLMAVLRRLLHLEEYITKTQFLGLGYLLAGMALIMIYFNLSEYVTSGYKLMAGVPFHLTDLFSGYLAPLFWFYFIGGILVVPVIIALPWTRNIKGIVVAAVLVIVAMWIERYLIVVGGFRVPLMQYSPRPYAPSWVEWSIFPVGATALFLLIISVFAKLFPMVSVWEVVEHRGPESAWDQVPDEDLEPLPPRARGPVPATGPSFVEYEAPAEEEGASS